jgi:hypothetical protein
LNITIKSWILPVGETNGNTGKDHSDANYQLAGLVEVDDSYFGGPKSGGKRGKHGNKRDGTYTDEGAFEYSNRQTAAGMAFFT